MKARHKPPAKPTPSVRLNQFAALPDLLTPAEVADMLRLACKRPSAIVRAMEREGLVVTRLRGKLRVQKVHLQQYVFQLTAKAGEE